MGAGSTNVQLRGVHFDLAAVGDWLIAHPVFTGLSLLAAYLFWISRPKGLLGVILNYRLKKMELDRKVAKDRKDLTSGQQKAAIQDKPSKGIGGKK